MLIGFPYHWQREVYTEAGHRPALVAIADWGGRAALIPRAAVEPAIGSESLREHGLRAAKNLSHLGRWDGGFPVPPFSRQVGRKSA